MLELQNPKLGHSLSQLQLLFEALLENATEGKVTNLAMSKKEKRILNTTAKMIDSSSVGHFPVPLQDFHFHLILDV